MDKIDAKILNILQKDCTLSVKDVAAMVGLSYTPTYERIRHLHESGIIKKSAVILEPSKVGIKLFAYCNVTLKRQSKEYLKQFEEQIFEMPEVLEVMSLSGIYDYMIKIATTDIDAYNDFIINKLADIPNIGQYHSSIVMSMVKNETSYLLSES
ncbi:MAG: Lrp/AsnC family transcriptional regulator [Limnohabitans sp.]|nr:Lrp/AsnC family transcriptional regulator [Limnohabitans sp.]